MTSRHSLMQNANHLRKKHGDSWWVIHLDGNHLNDQIENLIAVPSYAGPKVVQKRESNGGSITQSEVMAIWYGERETVEADKDKIAELYDQIKRIKKEANKKVRNLRIEITMIESKYGTQKKKPLNKRPRKAKKMRVKLRSPKKMFVQTVVRRSKEPSQQIV